MRIAIVSFFFSCCCQLMGQLPKKAAYNDSISITDTTNPYYSGFGERLVIVIFSPLTDSIVLDTTREGMTKFKEFKNVTLGSVINDDLFPFDKIPACSLFWENLSRITLNNMYVSYFTKPDWVGRSDIIVFNNFRFDEIAEQMLIWIQLRNIQLVGTVITTEQEKQKIVQFLGEGACKLLVISTI